MHGVAHLLVRPWYRYENYAYTFSAEPPFRVQAIARRPLLLRGRRVRFVSSLTYLGHSRAIDEAMVGVVRDTWPPCVTRSLHT